MQGLLQAKSQILELLGKIFKNLMAEAVAYLLNLYLRNSLHLLKVNKNNNKKDHKDFDWCKTYQLYTKYTKRARLLECVFKLLHRRIAANDFPKQDWTKRQLKVLSSVKKNRRSCDISCGDALRWSSSEIHRAVKGRNIVTGNYKFEISVALGLRPDSSNHPVS